MSDGEFRASPAEIVAAGQFAGGVADEIDEGVGAFARQVEGFLNGGWSGQAAVAFTTAWQSWRDGARDVVGGLDASARLLQASGQSYRKQESGNADSFHTGTRLNLG